MLTLLELARAMPFAPTSRLVQHLRPLVDALPEAAVTTRMRLAMYLAQLGHESGDFAFMVELPHRTPVSWCKLCRATGKGHVAGAQYEGRKDLGNTSAGDGERYVGRGVVQITGRYNYRRAGAALGLPLEAQPELAADVGNAHRIAAWYWRRTGCNEPSDHADVEACTRLINGGLTGIEDRRKRFARANTALGVGRLFA